MARIRATRGNFITGKLSVEAQANTDSEVYNFGLEMCENFLLKPLGGAYKRAGTEYLLFLLEKKIKIDGREYDLDTSDIDIRFFEYSYKNEKVLFFITSGRKIKDFLCDAYVSSYGFLREDDRFYQDFLYTGEYADSYYYTNHLSDISYFSSNNNIYLLIPGLTYYNQTVDVQRFIGFTFGLDLDKFSDLGNFIWESEPLFPIDKGQQLLISCEYSRVETTLNDLPWTGNLGELRIYATLLDKDGNPIIDDDYLEKFKNLRIFLKFTKTQTYPSGNEAGADRIDTAADKFATGVYWIGGEITDVVKREVNLPWDAAETAFVIRLKEDVQKKLFPILGNQDKAAGGQPSNRRNKQQQISDWFVSAFDSFYKRIGPNRKGYLGARPQILLPYKGRLHIFYNNWIFGSALGKGPMNFAMGDNSDDAFCVGWGDGKIGYVKWAFSASKMIIGASGGIFFSDSIVQNSGNQTSYQLPEMLTNITPSNVLPTLIGQSIIFVGSDNRSVYEIKLVGQEGPSVSKINSHCLGLFTEDITKIASDNDYLYAIGNGGQCNVCCFANIGFARRWFTYTFGGTAACLYDMFVFSNMKKVGFFQRRLLVNGEQLSSSIEEMKDPFDPYKDRAAEQFFLDCAHARFIKTPIENLNNGEAWTYGFDGPWGDFLPLLKNGDTIPTLFCRYKHGSDDEDDEYKYFGGKSCGCYFIYNRLPSDLTAETFTIKPFIMDNEEAKEDPTLRGQPIFDIPDDETQIFPLFDLDIWKYEFYALEEDDGSFVQFVRMEIDSYVNFPDRLLAVIFQIDSKMISLIDNKMISLTRDSSNGKIHTFVATTIDGNNPTLYPINMKNDDPNSRIYLSPRFEFSNRIFARKTGELATLEFESFEITPKNPYPIVIAKARGATGYNENMYNGIGSEPRGPGVSKIVDLYWKRKNINWQDAFDIPNEAYWQDEIIDPNNPDAPPEIRPIDISAYCATNGVYERTPKKGFAYFFMNCFKRVDIKHLIGETCQYTYDGNQGWFEVDDEESTSDQIKRAETFILSEDMFVEAPELFNPDDEDKKVLYVPKECVGTYLVVGLPYVSELCPVALEGGSLFGSSEGMPGISREAILTVFFSRGGKYGNSPEEKDEELYPLRYDASEKKTPTGLPGAGSPSLRIQTTASFNTALLTNEDNRIRSIYIKHDLPCNFSVLNIVQDVKVSDG